MGIGFGLKANRLGFELVGYWVWVQNSREREREREREFSGPKQIKEKEGKKEKERKKKKRVKEKKRGERRGWPYLGRPAVGDGRLVMGGRGTGPEERGGENGDGDKCG